MATFIEEVASNLYERYGDDISSLTLLMPSKRAVLFLSEALSRSVDHPIWEPQYMSVDELMLSLTQLRKCDKLRLIAELHKVYSTIYDEKFDSFYHWGEMLLSDFDMIDKYRVDAQQLFTNINDIKEIESDLSYLNEEQIAFVNRFWGTLKGHIGEDSAKEKFLTLWQSLGTIYTTYREHLRQLGIGYMGMIYRDAVERLEAGEAEIDTTKRYVFIGFNALSACEQALLARLDNLGCAEFYWDRDDYYTSANSYQEAGLFIRRNMKALSSVDGISHDNFQKPKSVSVISTATAIAQCQYVVSILKELAKSRPDGVLGKETAVVLTDENLLLPLLYALPEEMKVKYECDKRGRQRKVPNINVTMGYPLRTTLAYSFVDRLLDLQRRARPTADGDTFYHIDVDGLLTHPYISDTAPKECSDLRREIVRNRLYQVPTAQLGKTPLLQRLFRKVNGWQELLDYVLEMVDAVSCSENSGEESATRAEFMAAIYDGVTRLRNVIESCDMGEEMTDAVCRSLVKRYLQAERIPFIGEPLEGLQIMGILETRNLDFENVIILSMTDVNFPGNRVSDQSFIPYGLRYGFSLPTAEHHEGVYAYYFYRLIERAKSIYMLYSTQSDDKSSAEPSRYIRQLEYETDLKIKYLNVGVQVQLTSSKSLEVAKTDKVLERMMRFTDKGNSKLSPTAFSRYLKCPLQFYFASVEQLKVDDELDEEMDSATFGKIFHRAAEELYNGVVDEKNPMAHIKKAISEGALDRAVDCALLKEYFCRSEGELPELNGELQIIRDVVKSYLQNVVGYDERNGDFVVYKNELPISKNVAITANGEDYNIRFEGRADRIDILGNGLMRVLDYKTGSPRLEMDTIDRLFNSKDAKDHNSHIVNTLLYSMMLSHQEGCDVRPELYYVGRMGSKEYSPLFNGVFGEKKGQLTSYAECREEFEANVKSTLEEMYDKSVPFRQSEDENACTYCDFKELCGRKGGW